MNIHARKYIQHAIVVRSEGEVIHGKVNPEYVAMNKELKAYHKAKKARKKSK